MGLILWELSTLPRLLLGRHHRRNRSRSGVDYVVRPDENKVDAVNVVGNWPTMDSEVTCGACGTEDDLEHLCLVKENLYK